MKIIASLASISAAVFVQCLPAEIAAKETDIEFASAYGPPKSLKDASQQPVKILIVGFEEIDRLNEAFPAQAEMTQVQLSIDESSHGAPKVVPITKAEAIRLGLVFQALNIMDWATTKHCLDRGSCVEGNSFWGEDPDMTKMALIKMGVGGIHALYSAFLYRNYPEHYKKFSYGTIAVYGGVVAWNLQFAF